MSNISIVLFALGILLLIGGFVAYSYEYTIFGVPIGIRPYGDVGMLLMVLGVVLIIVGAVLSSIRKPQAERPQEAVSYSLMKCPECGAEYPETYIYCPECKAQLQPVR